MLHNYFLKKWKAQFWTWYGMIDYPALRTAVFLRDDMEQESMPHKELVQFTSYRPHTGDLRIAVDPSPISQLELDEMELTADWLDDLVTRTREKRPSWQLPEFRWGCVVRH